MFDKYLWRFVTHIDARCPQNPSLTSERTRATTAGIPPSPIDAGEDEATAAAAAAAAAAAQPAPVTIEGLAGLAPRLGGNAAQGQKRVVVVAEAEAETEAVANTAAAGVGNERRRAQGTTTRLQPSSVALDLNVRMCGARLCGG
jgi:hypothetical protein